MRDHIMSNFAMTKDEIDARRRVRASMLINQIEEADRNNSIKEEVYQGSSH